MSEPDHGGLRGLWAPALAVVAILVHTKSISGWMLDDAFIFFRYAENWVAGHGPVYNAGEHVEGYTSFTWMALLAGCHRVGLDTVWASKLLGFVLGFGCVALLVLSPARPRAGNLAALWLGTSGVFSAWFGSGMEVTLLAFLLLAFARCYRALVSGNTPRPKRAVLAGGLAALLAMTRPEGALVAGVALVHLVLSRRPRLAILAFGAAFAVIFVPWYAWRYAYYGAPLPNTFYVKVGTNADTLRRGAIYLLRFLSVAGIWFLPVFAAGMQRRLPREARFGVALFFLWSAYVVVVGGDIMPAFRFFAPILPLLTLASAQSLSVLLRPRLAAGAAMVLAACGVGCTYMHPDIVGRIRGDRVVRAGAIVGTWMYENLPGEALLATNTAGSVVYYSRLRAIDMLGLNDAHIAHREMPAFGRGWIGHEKYDGAYVLSRQPDYVQFASSLGAARPAYPSDTDLWNQPGFRQAYGLRSYRISAASGSVTLHLYCRNGAFTP